MHILQVEAKVDVDRALYTSLLVGGGMDSVATNVLWLLVTGQRHKGTFEDKYILLATVH